jgi:hypothetical protein
VLQDRQRKDIRTLECQIADLETLVRALLGRDDRGVTDERVVDTGIGDQVGLELVQVDVERTIEPERGGDGANNLSNEAVEVLIVGTGDVQAATADVIDGFVVDEERAVRVLDGAVCRQNSVVRLHNRCRDARRGIDGEFKLALLAVIGRETLKEQSTKPRSGSTAEGVEDEETLKRGAIV